jgi:hypothetical protein
MLKPASPRAHGHDVTAPDARWRRSWFAGDDVGPDDFKKWVTRFQSKIAELKLETIETFANLDGSRVSSRFRVTGRNNGMFGLPADGKPVAFTGNAVLAVTPDGKLAPVTGSSAAPGSSTSS